MEIPPFIFEEAEFDSVTPQTLDALLAQGWRHFGRGFFRYSIKSDDGLSFQRVLPLRIDLAEFRLSKSQRRILRRNDDVTVHLGPATVDEGREQIFSRHKTRFKTFVPDTLTAFVPVKEPSEIPCDCREIQMWAGGELLAVSYIDIGHEAVSSVYAIFEPKAANRSPGIFTLLKEIEFARSTGRRFLYLGYATIEPSHYDYKKKFTGLQRYDWLGNWLPFD